MTSTRLSDPRIHTARYLISTVNQVIEHGALLVDGSRIIAVSTFDELQRLYPRATVTNYGASVIAPGFVNVHTHLELTAMRGFLDDVEHDFFAWLKRLTIARRDCLTEEDLYTSAAWGAVEAVRAGITCAADAGEAGATSLRAMRDVGLRGIVYQELFGIDEHVAHEQLDSLKTKVAALRETANQQVQISDFRFQISDQQCDVSNFKSQISNPLVRIGISPHAPYTVSGKLIELASRYAIDEDLPVMMHAAESQAELAFMLRGEGAFAEGLKARNVAWMKPRVSTIRYLHERGLLVTKPLLAHCITVDESDLDLIRHHDAGIAHCPKSNLKLGHGRAPLAQMLRREIRVGLGSDSVASNNTNDLLEEARFALLLSRMKKEDEQGATFDVSVRPALEAATIGGARALRLENEVGTLEAGKQADFCVIGLTGAHQLPVYDVVSVIVSASSARDVVATIIAGREVYKNGKVMTIDEDDLRARVSEIGERLKSTTAGTEKR